MSFLEKKYRSVVKNWKRVKPFLPYRILKIIIPVLVWYVGIYDKKYLQEHGLKHLPPAKLRYKVHGDPFIPAFVMMGDIQKKDMEKALSKFEKNFNSFKNILDFGCGCGRTLLAFEKNNYSNFYGTDIDKEGINWCKNNLRFAKFYKNEFLPPLKYSSDFFDLVYSISVFTHLNEQYQIEWLSELKRILKPGGYLLITVFTSESLEDSRLSKAVTNTLEKKGFAFSNTRIYGGTFPQWYGNSYYTKEYAKNEFSKHFEFLDFIHKGMNNFQDIIILKKK